MTVPIRHLPGPPLPPRPGLPIIAMTANVFREGIERSPVAGINGHKGNPTDLPEIPREPGTHLA